MRRMEAQVGLLATTGVAHQDSPISDHRSGGKRSGPKASARVPGALSNPNAWRTGDAHASLDVHYELRSLPIWCSFLR